MDLNIAMSCVHLQHEYFKLRCGNSKTMYASMYTEFYIISEYAIKAYLLKDILLINPLTLLFSHLQCTSTHHLLNELFLTSTSKDEYYPFQFLHVVDIRNILFKRGWVDVHVGEKITVSMDLDFIFTPENVNVHHVTDLIRNIKIYACIDAYVVYLFSSPSF